MGQQTFKSCAASLLAIGLVCTSLIAISPRVHAAEASGIVSAAFQVYGWLTKHMRSDVDPTYGELLRNQELLKALELRFNEFEKAIHEAIRTLDELPDQYREILIAMHDGMQGNRVLALVDEIVQDQVTIGQRRVPTIDPKVRLHDLQVETGVLAKRSDLNAPTLIVAYRYELSLMDILGAHTEEIEQKRSRYNGRLLRVLNVDDSSSLAYDYNAGIRNVEEEQHRRALRDSTSPKTLNDEVRTARADIAEIAENLRAIRSTYIHEEHQWSDPPAGVVCP